MKKEIDAYDVVGGNAMNLFTMENTMPIVVVCVLIFFLLFLRPQAKLFLKYVIRFVLGFVLIIMGNIIFEKIGMPTKIGINFFTLLTSTILGFPGVCGLFAISFL